MHTHPHRPSSVTPADRRRSLWRPTTAGALLVLSVPAALAWSLNGIGILVLALIAPMVVARVRGRRNKRLVRILGWTTYGITAVAAVFMTAGLLLYSQRITFAHVAIISSSTIYLIAVLVLPQLLRRRGA
jgi:hypothetical protein